MKKKIYSLLLLLFFVTPLFAQTVSQNGFIIKGQVVDSLTNETVPYATLSIALASTPQTPVKLLACDEDGKFESSLNATGNYIMFLQSIGKSPARKTFTISENRKTLDLGQIYMQEDNQRLDEVTVVAQKPLVKVEIDKLTYSLEDDPEAVTNNTLDMLRKVPMITVDGEDKIQLKGSENFKIYLNGKPSNMLSSNNASDVLKSMPASSVKNIEVITEPGAKYDAEGVGGIINIVTTRNSLQGYTGTVRADASALGRFGAGANLSVKAGKFGITGNYNYRHQNSPWTDAETIRDTKGENPSQLKQIGRNKNKGPFQFGSVEVSYEIDTLNLLTVGANLFNGNMKNNSESNVDMNYYDEASNYKYRSVGYGKYTFGSTDLSLDYQRSTRKKDELFTVSYRFSNSPDDSESRTVYSGISNYPTYMPPLNSRWETNEAYTNEHTVQFDYTTPIREGQTLETGLKYINRQNNSNTDNLHFIDSTGLWTENEYNPSSEFRHKQHIYSVYAGYTLKVDKWGFKAGVRGEGTALNVKFEDSPQKNFKTDYYDVVPNGTISYQLNMAQQIRIGYNMRIQRPGIWYLNPYVNTTDPENISYGNPKLDSEKSHNINLNYSMFAQKININVSANYSFLNNAIERYTFINNETGVAESTFGNIGKRHQAGSYGYIRWNPVKFFNISLNGGVNYVSYKAESRNLENDGVSGRLFSNAQFILPKDINITLYGGYSSPWISLQGKGSSFYHAGFNVNKSFLDKKLTVTLSCNSPFWKSMKMTNETSDPVFAMKSTNHWRTRDFSIRVSYRFGTLKDSIKKVRRGIMNDDAKSGGNSGGGEGGGGGM
ncbi:outer membrane receptor protein involved in Fe transport [Parabacteroides sp. PF5-5]|uniref:TonB-dependent receptor domain-containing protein n=1 Tax=unclassified Parabacteroides TaxID=2649774 RepID=UPI0024761DB3|nr:MULTISPECIES: TonB-dependent receptor [unclassified Parabacteroides]MDH6306236.1 outer membrane receptor protein involved in Fe transport [Parabacteroides sp. PH5-39]MDH6316972.1 outer membrane receptor protein involved in Fe transport [Parabacteroides sp. PF5-13]MDH6321042.1 outer membrane receptor protein involved in Fe transport [Parabacteroides sp. PH5-13]MDH6324774.1 outer membrane receptor protein involved in Fe transport [Parabacteroides sp. PH5-8]MDH6328157.1 outer membrane receptor